MLKDFRRVLIIFGCPIDVFTPQNEQVIVGYDRFAIHMLGVYANKFCRALQNLTGYQIVVENRREHILDSGDVNPNK